jgi:hypothetical protein
MKFGHEPSKSFTSPVTGQKMLKNIAFKRYQIIILPAALGASGYSPAQGCLTSNARISVLYIWTETHTYNQCFLYLQKVPVLTPGQGKSAGNHSLTAGNLVKNAPVIILKKISGVSYHDNIVIIQKRSVFS